MTHRKTKRATSRAGFSFVELLVVMVIIGVMSGLAVPRIRDMKRRAFVTTLVTDLRNLAATQELYWADTHSYTSDVAALRFTHSDLVTLTIVQATADGWSATATHRDIAITCAVFYGSATPVVPAVQAAAIGCR